MSAHEVPIPEPAGYPIIGNLGELGAETAAQDLMRLSETYGEIFRLRLAGRSFLAVSTAALAEEVCDEQRFQKTVGNVLTEVRNGIHDGLFTATDEEPNWGIAHRVLIPAFGPTSIRGMYDEMHDLATQLAMKWARQGPNVPIPAAKDFTRLTLDTIALCAMGYRFNSFYREDMHPFLDAMTGFLKESGARFRRPGFANKYIFGDQQYKADIELLRKTAQEVLDARKNEPDNDRKDLLTAMLKGVDPRTGQRVSDDSIIDNLITFLIAGHETTSGMLSFAFYELLKNPDAYLAAQKEVDTVIGRAPVTVEHVSKLPYIAAVLRETLRLCPTIPAIARTARQDTIIGGKYRIPKGEPVTLLISRVHLDPAVYGADAREFKPERMLDAAFEARQKQFPASWKPFGTGVRACIGRPFAWQEAVLAMAMLLQNFTFTMADPTYTLQIQETLTLKPRGFEMKAALRHGMTPTELEHRLAGLAVPEKEAPKAQGAEKVGDAKPGKPLAIYYGSNSGTCEALAQRLASDAQTRGFSATVDPLDLATERLPTDKPVVLITASYEGLPPDNAARFVMWLQSLKGQEAAGVKYAVFGCGHRDWAQTFHRVPKLVDAKIEALGGERLAPAGLADASEGDLFSDFESWEDGVLFPALKAQYGVATPQGEENAFAGALSVEVSHPRTSALRQDVAEAVVVDVKALVTGDREKRHIEIRLPTGAAYRSGDYLAVLPLNPAASVSRAMRRFRLAWDAALTIAPGSGTGLPTGVPVAAGELLGAYVELAQPATKRNILTIAAATTDKDAIARLEKLAGDDYSTEVTAKRLSILDILDEFPSVELPLGVFLGMLPPMRVRQYSISSSPLANPSNATLTYSLLDSPALSGHGRHVGVATSYLASLAPGDKVHVAVRPAHSAFHLPVDPEKTPIIMIGAGSGIAPFRAFVQERAAMLGAGRKLAPALLFAGSRNEDEVLYKDEFERWEKMGAVEVRRAFSRAPDGSDGCKYVQDRLWKDRDDVGKLWHEGALAYICGSRELGKGVDDVAVKMAASERQMRGEEADEDKVRSWWEGIRNDRYATDVFD